MMGLRSSAVARGRSIHLMQKLNGNILRSRETLSSSHTRPYPADEQQASSCRRTGCVPAGRAAWPVARRHCQKAAAVAAAAAWSYGGRSSGDSPHSWAPIQLSCSNSSHSLFHHHYPPPPRRSSIYRAEGGGEFVYSAICRRPSLRAVGPLTDDPGQWKSRESHIYLYRI